MKRQHTCAAALMLSCVFATPSNARPDPQSTVGAVTQFCGDRVCPAYLLTTPKVVERRTVRRHQRVARAVLPKARPLDANGNPGRGLVTVETRQPFSLRRPLYDKLRNRAFESETGASICRTFVAEAVEQPGSRRLALFRRCPSTRSMQRS